MNVVVSSLLSFSGMLEREGACFSIFYDIKLIWQYVLFYSLTSFWIKQEGGNISWHFKHTHTHRHKRTHIHTHTQPHSKTHNHARTHPLLCINYKGHLVSSTRTETQACRAVYKPRREKHAEQLSPHQAQYWLTSGTDLAQVLQYLIHFQLSAVLQQSTERYPFISPSTITWQPTLKTNSAERRDEHSRSLWLYSKVVI